MTHTLPSVDQATRTDASPRRATPIRSRWLVALGVTAAFVGLSAGQATAAEAPTIGEPIPTGNSPYQVGALPQLNKLFVAENGDHAVGVYDTEQGEFTSRIPLPDKTPLAVETNPTTNTVYVGTYEDTIEVVDGEQGTVRDSYQAGEHVHSLGVDVAGDRVAAANSMSNTVTIFDSEGYGVGVNVGELPVKPTFSADGNKLYVTNAESNTVSMIGTAPDDYWPSVDKTLQTETWPLHSALDPNTNKLYFSNWEHNTVQVIDTATDNVVNSIPVGTAPIGIAVNPDTNSVYVANSESNNLSIIDTGTDTVRATVDTNGQFPLGLAVSDPNTAYVTNRISNNMNVLTDPGQGA